MFWQGLIFGMTTKVFGLASQAQAKKPVKQIKPDAPHIENGPAQRGGRRISILPQWVNFNIRH